MRSYHDIVIQEDANVVIVGWGGSMGAGDPNYNRAASTTRTIGADLGDAISHLLDNGGDPNDMWCAGHSLGSHVCGYTGKRTQTHGGRQIARVTGRGLH